MNEAWISQYRQYILLGERGGGGGSHNGDVILGGVVA